ncbi:MAG: hypothetical protein V4613_02890 [Bacteroidota bacterium]
MRKTIILLTILIIAFLSSCTDSVNKELYGTYIRSIDSGLIYSKFILYPEKKYSFYGRSCFESKSDSGSFAFNNDTIYFTSCYKERDTLAKTNSRSNLTGEKVLFQPGQLMYIIASIKPEFHYKQTRQNIDSIMRYDTVFWIKDTKKQ